MTEEIADAVPNAELISQCETRYRDVELDHFSWVRCFMTSTYIVRR